MPEMVVLHRDIPRQKQESPGAVVMKEIVAYDQVARSVIPVEKDEASGLRRRKLLREGKLIPAGGRVDGPDFTDRGREAGGGVVAVAQLNRIAHPESILPGVAGHEGMSAGSLGESGVVVRIQAVVGAVAEFAVLHFEKAARA